MMHANSQQGLTSTVWIFIIAGILVVIAFFVFIFSLLIIPLFYPPVPSISETNPQEESSGEVTVEDITNNPTNYYGTSVSLNGQFDGLVGENGFLITQPGVVGLDLLVVSSTNARELFSQENVPGDEKFGVAVVGDVEQFDISTVEQQIGVNLDNNLFQPYQGKPVIIATQIAILSGTP